MMVTWQQHKTRTGNRLEPKSRKVIALINCDLYPWYHIVSYSVPQQINLFAFCVHLHFVERVLPIIECDVLQSNIFLEMPGSLTFCQNVSEANNVHIALEKKIYMHWFEMLRVVE